MAQYKLTYFDIKGLGEPIRLLLSYGGKDFEDVRVKFQDWPNLKKSMPMGQMPVLEINGKAFNQSIAISRYLATEFKLNGDNSMEALQIDIAVDNINDFRAKLASIHFYEQGEDKEKKFAELDKEYINSYLDKLEKGATGGHMALNKLTWADFYFTALADVLKVISRRDIFENRPNLAAVKENVLALPAIQAWYAKAPKSDM